MMSRNAKRAAAGTVVAAGWLLATSAIAAGVAPEGREASPWAKAGLGTQVVATLVLWNGQRRHDDRLKVIEQVISLRPCILKRCEAEHKEPLRRSGRQ